MSAEKIIQIERSHRRVLLIAIAAIASVWALQVDTCTAYRSAFGGTKVQFST